MRKSVYDADDDGVVDLAKNANKALNANNAEVADNATHALMSEKAWGLESSDGTYSVSAKEANDMYDCFHKEGADLKLSDSALSSATTTKLSKGGEQILGTVSGNTATFTDARIGGSDVYLTDIYCSDSERYIKSQSVSGNVLTVTFDDSVASATCVAQLYKKGV